MKCDGPSLLRHCWSTAPSVHIIIIRVDSTALVMPHKIYIAMISSCFLLLVKTDTMRW